MAKTIVDLKETPPKAIPSLTKDAMLYYIKKYGTKEDKVWYVELCKSNTIKKTNNITKEVAEGLDISKIRKAFAQKFFSYLLEEKKAKSKTKSYMDLLEELLED
jgi:hypothetical protein